MGAVFFAPAIPAVWQKPAKGPLLGNIRATDKNRALKEPLTGFRGLYLKIIALATYMKGPHAGGPFFQPCLLDKEDT